MEFVEGETLEKLIRRSGRLEIKSRRELPGRSPPGWLRVGQKYFLRRGMQRHETGLFKLRSTDRKNPLRPVHILWLKIDRFAQPQPADCQQTKQAVIGVWLQLVRRFDF